MAAETIFGTLGPPNSARPNTLKLRRMAKRTKARMATTVKTVMEKAKLPGGTVNREP